LRHHRPDRGLARQGPAQEGGRGGRGRRAHRDGARRRLPGHRPAAAGGRQRSVTRLLFTAGSAVALIFFVAFVVRRLLRSRSRGLSIRMQFFVALASIVGAFALGLGLLVLDRLEARTTVIAEGTAREEAEAIAALVGSEMDARGVGLLDVARKYAAANR